jgi:hypothetical protein
MVTFGLAAFHQASGAIGRRGDRSTRYDPTASEGLGGRGLVKGEEGLGQGDGGRRLSEEDRGLWRGGWCLTGARAVEQSFRVAPPHPLCPPPPPSSSPCALVRISFRKTPAARDSLRGTRRRA